MRRVMTTWLLLLASCGARITGNPEDEHGGLDAGAGIGLDATSPHPDAPPPDAAPLGPWSAPTAVTVAATQKIEDDVTLTSNALEMVYAIADPTFGKKDLYYTSRTSIGAPWALAVPLPFNTAASDETPRFSTDDRTLYFASGRNTTDGNLDIFSVTHAATATALWGTPQPVAPFSTAATEKWLSPCSDGHYVVVQSTPAGDTDLFEGKLGGGAPTAIAALNTTSTETGAFLTPDCLTLYFASFRVTPEKIFVSHRATVTSPWQTPAPVDDFTIAGGNGNQEDPWLSPDGRTFAFASDAAGTKDVYLSTR